MKLGYHFLNGKQYVLISQSLMKQFIMFNDPIEFCPYQIKRTYIDKAYDKRTDAMTNGVFFESLAIGGDVRGNTITDLPRLRTGKKSTDHKRIESQVLEFKRDANELELEIDRFTSQQRFCKVWHGMADVDIIVIFIGGLDLLSPIKYNGEKRLAAIDLKLTKDVSNTNGNFCWGSPNDMDHTQAYSYSWMTGLPFYYMVYDYKPKMEKKSPLKVNINAIILKEFFEALRKAVANIIYEENTGWQPRPGLLDDTGFRKVPKCEKCIVKDCKFYKKNIEIN